MFIITLTGLIFASLGNLSQNGRTAFIPDVVSNNICFSIPVTIANELLHPILKHLLEDVNPKLLLGLHFLFVITLGTNPIQCRYEGLGCRFRIIFSDYCAPGILSANGAFHRS